MSRRATPTAELALRAPTRSGRGRPPVQSEEDIAFAALEAFATRGYDGVSLRSLSAELGLSHSALGQRFSTKEALFNRTIDHAFARFAHDIALERERRPVSSGDLDELRELLRAFLVVAHRYPQLGQLMSREGVEATTRFAYIESTVLRPQIGVLNVLLERLRSSGQVGPVSARALFFLVAHGAEAPFTLRALSGAFDELDGLLDADAHIEQMTDFIIAGLCVGSHQRP